MVNILFCYVTERTTTDAFKYLDKIFGLGTVVMNTVSESKQTPSKAILQ